MKRKWIITACIIVVFIVGAILYNIFGKPSAEGLSEAVTSRGRSTLHVNGEIIRQHLLTDGITTLANLLADEEVDLSFETSGKIVGIFFQEGAPVKKGQLLAKINDTPLQAQLLRYQSQLKLAEARVSRQSTLLEKDAVSQEAFEQATTELAMLNADIDLIRANIAQTELRAPFDGIIGLRNVSEGAYASPSTVIAHLTKISPLKVEFAIPAQYAPEIRPGLPVTFITEGFSESFQASVYAVSNMIDQDLRTFMIRAIYPNANGKLRPGGYTNVSLQLMEIPQAITVPSEALIMEMGVNKVYLYKDGKAQPRDVQTGIRTAGRIQVIEGIQPGDTLITSGTLQLRTGLPVILDEIN